MLLKNGIIHDAVNPKPYEADISTEPTVRTPFFVLCGGSFCERKPPNFCALPWQDWQNVILRLAGPPCRSQRVPGIYMLPLGKFSKSSCICS